MARCICDIVCVCDKTCFSPSPIGNNDLATVNASSVGACLLGKTRPIISSTGTADEIYLFNICNEYRTYAYTLSPKSVGIMAGKTRDRQYQTLKRLHNEVLSMFECSYIINIEIYPNSSNDLHCHGVIRFRSHNKKEEFKKMLKTKITLGKKGTYDNLIDCEFVNNFDIWSDYIMKSQEVLLSQTDYIPFKKIDYSFHINKDVPRTINIPVSEKARVRKVKDPEAYKNKLILQAKALEIRLNNLNNLLCQM